MNDEQRNNVLTYLQSCITENLNHARHVENERLTFTSIYIAMVIGAVAVVFGLENRWISSVLTASLFVFALMALRLNTRWQSVFDDHTCMAEKCHKAWVREMTQPGSCTPQELGCSEEDCLGYFYSGYNKPKTFREACINLFGYSLHDIRRKQLEREAKKQAKAEQPEPGTSENRTDKGNASAPKKNNAKIQKRFFRVPDLFKRTRHMFALLYLLVAVLLLVLTVYLVYHAITDPNSPNFYFSKTAISDLESFINTVLEDAKK